MSAVATAAARARSLLALQPGEGRIVLTAGGFHLLFVAAVVLVKSAASALVVARHPPAVLPVLYVATALITGVGAAVAGRLMPAAELPVRSALGAGAILASLTVAVKLELPGAVTLLYLFGDAFATLTSIRFWSASSELVDARAGKRVFALLGGAGMAGAVAGGLGAQLVGASLGAWALLPIAVVTIAACAVPAKLAPVATPRGRASSAAPPPIASYLAARAYPKALAAMMVLLAILTALADFLFRLRAGAKLSEAELASLFGALNLWMGVSSVLFQFGVAGRLLARFGAFRYLLLTPIGAALAAIACLFHDGIAPAFALRLVESAGSLSLNAAAFQLLYGPLPDALRSRVRSVVDGLVKKGGFALGGVLILPLAASTGAGEPVLVGAVVVVVAAFAVVLARTRGLYGREVEERILGAAGRAAELDLDPPTARAIHEGALRSADPRRVRRSLAVLLDDPRFPAARLLPELLAHEDERVRVEAIRGVARRGIIDATGPLLGILRTDGRRARHEAALALATIAPARARHVLAPMLLDPDPGLSAAAIAALLPLEGGTGPATEALQARFANVGRAGPAERRETARLLGRLADLNGVPTLVRLLADEDRSVRRLACEAAAKLGDPLLDEALAARLADRTCRAAARLALTRRGDAVVPLLERLLNDRGAELSVRIEVARVLGQLATDAAARALLFSNIQDDASLRYRIAVALGAIATRRPGLTLDPTRVREAVGRRLEAYLRYLPTWRDLEEALPRGAPIRRAMAARLHQNLDTVFRLLQALHPEHAIHAAFRRFRGGDAHARAFSLELLDEVLDEELRDAVVPVLERFHLLPEPRGRRPGDPSRLPQRLQELAAGRDVLLRACARHALAQRGWPCEADEAREDDMDEALAERVFFLEGVEFFSECDVDDLVALASMARERTVADGEAVFREGEPGDSLFVIVEGLVQVERGGVRVFDFATKEAFGEASLLDGSPRAVTAIARGGELKLLQLDRQDFLDLIAERPELLQAFFAALARHLRMALDAAARAGGAPR